MYIVLNHQNYNDFSVGSGLELIHSYPRFVLLKTPVLPKGIPEHNYEVLEGATVNVNGTPFDVPEGKFQFGKGPRTVLRFVGPITREWKKILGKYGIEVLFWCPPYGACVQMNHEIEQEGMREGLPFVAGAQPYRQIQCTRNLDAPSESARRASGLPENFVDIVCFSREDRLQVEGKFKRMGVPVLLRSAYKLRVEFHDDRAILRRIKGVKVVDDARAPELLSSSLSSALGLSVKSRDWQTSFKGRGQIVAVADTGLDKGVADDSIHADFRGRVRYLTSWPINDSWSQYVKHPGHDDGAEDRNSGHGTHVAGLAVGSGILSGSRYRGVAPEAQIVFQAIEQYTEVKRSCRSRMPSSFYLSGRPLDLRRLFNEAREYGARIHINSWGDPANGQYTDDCYEADMFLHKHQDAVILFAAGNSGVDLDGNREVDRRSLYSPASAKNVIAIGATEGGDIGTGNRGTWADIDRQRKRFRNEIDRKDRISGDPESIALFSSAGPTADNRIKPDICAPGTNLAAPRSSATKTKGWGLASPLPHYMYYGGTSMSTGVAGGFAAILRQAWQERNGGRAPSGPALKALMILGARPVLKRADNKTEPRHVGGFGRINFEHSVPDQLNRAVRLFDEAESGLLTGEERTYSLSLRSPGPLRAVLTWYDVPGETLVNDLDLHLAGPGGLQVWGNHAEGKSGRPDRVNTVEVISLNHAEPGVYTFTVIAANVPAGLQTFALAVLVPESGGITLPVDVIKGIGKGYAKRLAGHQIKEVRQLMALDENDIRNYLGTGGRIVQRLMAGLILLKRILNLPETETLPDDLRLDRLRDVSPPDEVNPGKWNEMRLELLPLVHVFDAHQLKKITFRDLFG